jgi:hypothetical protein
MDAGTLLWIFKVLKFLGGLAKPTMEWYNKWDQKSFGILKYLLMTLGLILLTYIAGFLYRMVSWIIRIVYGLIMTIISSSSSSSKGASSVPLMAETVASEFTAETATASVASSAASEASAAADVVVDAAVKVGVTAGLGGFVSNAFKNILGKKNVGKSSSAAANGGREGKGASSSSSSSSEFEF